MKYGIDILTKEMLSLKGAVIEMEIKKDEIPFENQEVASNVSRQINILRSRIKEIEKCLSLLSS